eukprot:Sspe_Gene.17575::Locus_6242_Transcript_2_2_Confidence_0.750_Length_2592::g.17575::m.17575
MAGVKGVGVGCCTQPVSREFAECRGCAAETTEYAQVWSDEFFGSVVEPTRWGYDLGAGGWGNQEWQRYTTHSAVVNGGHLTIKAEREERGVRVSSFGVPRKGNLAKWAV